MSRTNPVRLLAVLVGIVVVLGGVGAMAPALYIDRHDGDVLHLMDMVFRMTLGQMPHLDFVTPLGILSIWPIAAMIELGFGAGHAVIAAQIALACLLLLPTWWVAWTRFSGLYSVAFGGSVLVLCLAMIHGETLLNLSMSMHYNRWAWALSFLALAIGFVPPIGKGSVLIDALVLGLAMALLTLLKVTFMVAFAVPILLILLLRRDFARVGAAVLVAALALGLSVLVLGLDFWLAYAGDLIATAKSDLRGYPGMEPVLLASAPAYVVGTVLTLAAVVVLRSGGRPEAGLAVLVLLPAAIYVTAQNFGNDPKWMWLLGLILLATRPEAGRLAAFAWDARGALSVIASGLLVASAPSFVNMISSPFRNWSEDPGAYIAMLPNRPRHDDFRVYVEQAMKVDLIRPGDGTGSGLEWTRDFIERKDPVVFMGEELEVCYQKSGFQGWARTIAADLVTAGYDGQQIFNVDLLNIYWLLEPSLPPLAGAAPWIYDGLPGWKAADLVLVPNCPLQPPVRAYFAEKIAEKIAAGETRLTEVRRTPLYTLWAKEDL